MAQYPNRRTLTDTSNNTSVVTVTRNVGQISQEGDAWNATNMNDLETRINNAFTAEASDRATAIQSAVNNEKTERQNADSQINTRINNLRTGCNSLTSVVEQIITVTTNSNGFGRGTYTIPNVSGYAFTGMVTLAQRYDTYDIDTCIPRFATNQVQAYVQGTPNSNFDIVFRLLYVRNNL